MERFPKAYVDAVDKLVQEAAISGVGTRVDSPAAWMIVLNLWRFWRHFFRDEHDAFIKSQNAGRRLHVNKHASAREKGGAEVRHLAEFPEKWHRLMREFFPDQNWDKKFVRTLIQYIPVLQVPDKV